MSSLEDKGTARDPRTGLFHLMVMIGSLGSFLLMGCDSSSPTEPTEITVDCSVYPEQTSSPYVLPYAVGQSFLVLQTLEHRRFGSRTAWAIDFDMPIGTPLHAPTSGTVVWVVDVYSDSNHEPGHENFIVVEDDHGGAWDFGHIQQRGSLKRVGDRVTQGEVVATSGFSGNAGSPHLHLEIRQCWSGRPYDDCSRTVPATFRNTQPHACGLQVGTTYLAESF